MINLIPLIRIVVFISVTYSATVLSLFALLAKNRPIDEAVSWAATGGTFLHWVLLALVYFGWRVIWKIFPRMNKWVFPDLNGKWDVTINYMDGLTSDWKEVIASAYIKQSFLTLSIHLKSDKSESDTLSVVAKKDSQEHPVIYYSYLNRPKNVDGEKRVPYEGAATLRLSYDDLDELSGNYFTEAGTKGRFIFAKSRE